MTLPSPNLDDRKFQDIVDEAKRLIPSNTPEWTNHNHSDPGEALIELFAWMSEMLLFRLNQVPDRLYSKFLDLVGIEPYPSSSARTDLTFWLSSSQAEAVVVPAGTQVGTPNVAGEAPVLFATLEDLTVVQPVLAAAVTTLAEDDELVTDVWEDLRYPTATTPCFGSEPQPRPGDAFNLGFEGSLAGNVVRLDVQATIEGIGVDPRNPPLSWEVWAGESWIPATVHEDTTGGLNREGSILLLMPMAHAPLTIGTKRLHWLRARLAVADIGQPTYQTSPRMRSVAVSSLGGTVPAEHAQTAGPEIAGRSDGSPDQRFLLRHHPVLPRRGGETVRVTLDGATEEWAEVADFSASTKDDQHVVWDPGSGTIRFGPNIRYPDGTTRQHGAVPPGGAEIGVAGYRYGGGASGNVGANTLTSLQTTIPFIGSVTNLRAATGGVEAETVDNAKLRGPMTLRTGQRAVTAHDFERLTMEASPAVARARCLPPERPGGPVRVLVVPYTDKPAVDLVLDDFALSDDLVATVSAHLDERRVVGTSIEIGTPYYQGVTVAALVKTLPGRPGGLVRQRALDALYQFVNPLTGGPQGEGWPFDTDLNSAIITQLLSGIDGVDRVEEVLFFEYDVRNGSRLGAGREVVRLDAQALFLSVAHQVVAR
ncbi:MAG: putative baseplate assembly protein [Actinomycetia bacterium]|nr:putative baseplate assembly protein [Actinomycetes bacterium]